MLDNKLALLIDHATGTGYVLQEDSIIIGRDPSCSICLGMSAVSRRHMMLARGGDGWYVRDLSSTNGVILNGYRLPVEQYFKLDTGANLEIPECVRFYFTEDVDELVRYGVIPPQAAEPENATALLPPEESVPAPVPQNEAPPLWTEPEKSAPAAEPQNEMPPLWTEPEKSAPAAEPQNEMPPLWTEPEESVPTPAPQDDTPLLREEPVESAPAPAPQDDTPLLREEPEESAPAPAPQDDTPLLWEEPEESAPAPAPQEETPPLWTEPVESASAPITQDNMPPLWTEPVESAPTPITQDNMPPLWTEPTESAAAPITQDNMPPLWTEPAESAPAVSKAAESSWQAPQQITPPSLPREQIRPAAPETPVQAQNAQYAASAAPTAPAEKKSGSKKLPRILAAAAILIVVLAGLYYAVIVRNSESRAAEKEIAAIGEVTLSSQADIAQARAAYENLSDSDKQKVKNLDTLEQSEAIYQTLVAQQTASDFDAAVRSVSQVTLDSGSLLEGLRTRYKLMDAAAKSFVTEEGRLSDLEAQYQQLQLKKQASDADQMISDIGEVTLSSESKLKSVRSAVDALPSEVRSLMSNLTLLKQKEARLAELKETKAFEELKALSSSGDPKDVITQAGSFLKTYSGSSYRTEAETICVNAYLALAKQYESKKAYESAKNTLEECKALGLSADNGKSEAALSKLMSTISKLRPANGKVISGNCRGGYCQLIVKSGDTDVYVKLQNVNDPSKTLVFYVRKNEQAKINIKNGTYTFKYATGDTWYGTEELFGENTVYSQADTTLSFSTSMDGRYIYYQTRTITLYKVAGGNMSTKTIGKNDF